MAMIDKGRARPATGKAQRTGVEQDDTRHSSAHSFEELATRRTVLVDSTHQVLKRVGWVLVRKAAQCRQQRKTASLRALRSLAESGMRRPCSSMARGGNSGIRPPASARLPADCDVFRFASSSTDTDAGFRPMLDIVTSFPRAPYNLNRVGSHWRLPQCTTVSRMRHSRVLWDERILLMILR